MFVNEIKASSNSIPVNNASFNVVNNPASNRFLAVNPPAFNSLEL